LFGRAGQVCGRGLGQSRNPFGVLGPARIGAREGGPIQDL